MKHIKRILLVFLIGAFISACANSATTSENEATNETADAVSEKPLKTSMHEKYLFPDLEQVKYIRNHKISGWSDIDRQSLFVSVSPKTSYLIILRSPSYDLPYSHGINFSSSAGSNTYAKFDRIDIINIQNNINPPPAYIERIYKVESKEQKAMIKAQIKDGVLMHETRASQEPPVEEAGLTE